MTIQLGSIPLDRSFVGVREQLEEVGGRGVRTVTLSGLIAQAPDRATLDLWLDAVIAEASRPDFGCALSVRPGRRLWVRRQQATREVRVDPLAGSFVLRLAAQDPLEESTDESVASLVFATLPANLGIAVGGSAPAQLRITVAAASPIEAPAVSDGTRTLAYEGIVPAGEALVFEGATGRATLAGENVTPYTQGLFPAPMPGPRVITLTAENLGTVSGVVTVACRDRWW